MNNYKWSEQATTMDYYFEILPVNDKLPTDVKVEIIANTKKPYKTKISKQFSYHLTNVTNDGIDTKFSNDLVFDKLLITNTFNENKCISIEWDNNNYRIKNNNNILKSFEKNGYINKVNININAKNYKILEFQKKNKSIEGDINSFTISDC